MYGLSSSVVFDSCEPMDCSLPGSSVHGILQARILEWVATTSFNLPNSGIKLMSLASLELAGGLFTTSSTWEALLKGKWSEVKVTQSSPTLCDPMGNTVHGIFQARILEWVVFPFSKGSSQPRDQIPGLPHCRWIFYQLSHKGSLLKEKVWI